jgi:hypothetical protein
MVSPKRPALDMRAFQQAAVKQADPVALVRTRQEQPEPPRPRPTVAARPATPAPSEPKRQKPSREGRVQIMGWFPTATRLAMKRVALESGKTLEQVMGEAFEQYLDRNRVSK